MADVVPPEDIERIVGAQRQEHAHLARLVSAEDRIYVLHSHDCVRETPDLRDCPVSLALDRGVNSLIWSEWADTVARVRVSGATDRLVPSQPALLTVLIPQPYDPVAPHPQEIP